LAHGSRRPLIRGALAHVGVAHYYARFAAANGGINYAWKERLSNGAVIPRSELVTDPDRFFTPTDAVEMLALREGSDWIKEIPAIQPAVQDYTQWAPGADRDLRVVGIESEVRAIIGGHPYTARLDIEFRDSISGRHWIVDTKTAARMESGTLRAFALDGQILGLQCFGWARYGEAFGGVIINVVGLGNQVGSDRFDRVRVDAAPWSLAQFPQQMAEVKDRIAWLKVNKPDPLTWRKAWSSLICRHRYGECEFFDTCRMGPTS
jgi:hypothetical protein